MEGEGPFKKRTVVAIIDHDLLVLLIQPLLP
jgi:hypothetical protein